MSRVSALLRRHVYGLSPADGVYAGGDTEDETPNLKPSVLTLDAIALGEPDHRTRELGKRFSNAVRSHYLSMRDDAFVAAVARELEKRV